MNALLWTLVATLAPGLVGLIIYLLVRGNYSDLRCPQCDETVKEQFVVCPKCGIKLRAACSNCAMPVEPDWKVCPKCTQPLSDVRMEVQAPVRARDTSFWKILAIALIIPVVLLAILLLSRSAALSSGSSGFREVTEQTYFEVMDREGGASEALIAEKVRQWLNGMGTEPTRACALRYDHATDSGTEYFFLVYIPGAGNQTHSGMGQTGSIFGTTLTLELHRTGSTGALFNIISSSGKAPNLKIILDGKRIPCDVTTVDYNPTLFFIEP